MNNQLLNNLTTILSDANHYLSDIASSVKNLSSDSWVMYGAIANILLAIGAVYTANKDYFNNLIFKPKIRAIEPFALKQGAISISRLRIKNIRKQVAKNVTFWIEELSHYENDNWKRSTNFLQFPLRWTHDLKNEYKDLYYERPYSLDLCDVFTNTMNGMPEIRLCTLYCNNQGTKAHGLDDLKTGKNKILLALYCENHPMKNYWVELEWDGTLNDPNINIR